MSVAYELDSDASQHRSARVMRRPSAAAALLADPSVLEDPSTRLAGPADHTGTRPAVDPRLLHPDRSAPHRVLPSRPVGPAVVPATPRRAPASTLAIPMQAQRRTSPYRLGESWNLLDTPSVPGPQAPVRSRVPQSAVVIAPAYAARAVQTNRAQVAHSAQGAAVRLTARGVVVLAVLTAAVAVVIVALAWLSAPHPVSSPVPSVPTMITVQPGDTLWSIAGQVAPNRDPRDVVSDLRSVNDLKSPYLVPGQTLRTR
jgi:LysM repeat protein